MLCTVKSSYNRKTGEKIAQEIVETQDDKSENFYDKVSRILAEDIISNINKLSYNT